MAAVPRLLELLNTLSFGFEIGGQYRMYAWVLKPEHCEGEHPHNDVICQHTNKQNVDVSVGASS